MNTPNKTPLPKWKARRLGKRAVRVWERQKDASPTVASFEHTLLPAQQELEQTDAAISTKAAEVGSTSYPHSDALWRAVRGWFAPVERDMPELVAQQFSKRANTPDDAVNQAVRLVEVVKDRGLPYAERLVTELEPLIVAADAEVKRADQALAELQALRAEGRKAVVRLQNELISFRQALRVVLGSSHRDYQKLRTARSGDEDGELDAAPSLPAAGNGASHDFPTSSEVGVRAAK